MVETTGARLAADPEDREPGDVLASSLVGLFILRVGADEAPVFEYISPRAARVLGLAPGALSGNRANAFGGIHESDRGRLIGAMRASMASRQPFNWVGTLEIDGSARTIRFDAEPEVRSDATEAEADAASPADRWFCVVEDVTDAARTLRTLALRDAALREAEHVGRVGSWTLIPDEGNTWSEELFRIHGVDPGDGVPPVSRYAQFLSADDFARADAAIRNVIEHGEPYEIEYDIHRPDGSSRRMLSRGAPILAPDGSIHGVRGTLADITEIAAARDSIRASAGLQRSVFEALADGIVVQDLEGRITASNPSARRILGLELDAITGRTSFDPAWAALDEDGNPFPGDRHPAMVTLATGEPCREVLMNLAHPDGRRVWIRVNSEVLRDDNGATIGVVASFTDVTALRAMEDRLRKAEQLEAVGRLAGGVAHEFNNILMGVLGYSEVARESVEPDSQLYADLGEIIGGARHAAHLVHQLLAFSRRQALHPAIVDPGAVVAGMEPALRGILGPHVNVVARLEPGLHHIRIDPSQLEQLLTELATNARDAMPDGGTFAIDVRGVQEPVAGVRIMVRDTGLGMDEATLARAFEPFFTTNGPNRAGMGLATVLGVVEQSGGTVDLRSVPDRGTTVTITLPPAPEPHADPT